MRQGPQDETELSCSLDFAALTPKNGEYTNIAELLAQAGGVVTVRCPAAGGVRKCDEPGREISR